MIVIIINKSLLQYHYYYYSFNDCTGNNTFHCVITGVIFLLLQGVNIEIQLYYYKELLRIVI